MIDFAKNNSWRFWQIMFFLFATTVTLETIAFFSIWFFIPSNLLVGAFPSLTSLPAKYLILIILGGFSKDFMIGVFTYHAWLEWHRLKAKKSI